ncbi:MAG: D-alanyl-D-alanine carboxypeptidase family protein [Acidimicrobiales bacterium]
MLVAGLVGFGEPGASPALAGAGVPERMVGLGAELKGRAAGNGPEGLTLARSTTLRGTVSQAVGDLDGDGRQDLVRAELDAGPGLAAAVVFFGRVDGGVDRTVVAGGGDPVAAMAVVTFDHNGDGTDELLWYDPTGARPSLLWQLSGYRQWSSRQVTAPPPGSSPVVGDLSGDGREDLLWHGGAGGDLLSRATTAGFLGEPFWPEGGLDPFVGNFDGDGAQDVIWYDDVTGRGVLWWGGSKLSAAPFDIGTGSTLRVGQFDGVGGDDLLVTGPNGFVELDGSGNRLFYPSLVPVWVAPGSTIADVNGDRRSDVVLIGSASQPEAHGVWNNDAGGWLWEAWPWSEVAQLGRIDVESAQKSGLPPAVLLVGDLDGDDTEETILADATTNEAGPVAGMWQRGYRREAIYRHPNPWSAPHGLVVRTLGITAGRAVNPPLRAVTDGCGGGWLVHAAIADLAQGLLSAAAADGLALCINFGYRSFAEQAALRARRCAEVGFPGDLDCIERWSSGQWPFDGSNQIQRPGYSRHQLGLAIDLGDGDGYATAAVTTWLSANAHRFGFYNLGDRHRLGPAFRWGSGAEPWHISLDGR